MHKDSGPCFCLRNCPSFPKTLVVNKMSVDTILAFTFWCYPGGLKFGSKKEVSLKDGYAEEGIQATIGLPAVFQMVLSKRKEGPNLFEIGLEVLGLTQDHQPSEKESLRGGL